MSDSDDVDGDGEKEVCGQPTRNGGVCQNPASEGGNCWIPSHGGSSENHGKRSTMLSKERVDRITSHIAEGKSVTSAARMENVPTSTFYNWLDKADDRDRYDADEHETDESAFEADPYGYLMERFVRARGLGEDSYIQDILSIARDEGDLSTLLSMVKQRYPESWGDVNRGEQAGGVVVNASDPDEHEVDPDTLELVDKQ